MKTQDFAHNFPGTEVSKELFDVYGTPVVVNNMAKLAPFDEIDIKQKLDFHGSYITTRMTADPGVIVGLRIDFDNNNLIEVEKSSTWELIRITESGEISTTLVDPYDYIRIRDVQNTIYFEGSNDARQWFLLRTEYVTFGKYSCKVSYDVVDEFNGFGLENWGLTPWGA